MTHLPSETAPVRARAALDARWPHGATGRLVRSIPRPGHRPRRLPGMRSRTVTAAFPIDVARTLAPLRRGGGDPTMRTSPGEVWRASRTPEGPVTAHLVSEGDRVRVEAWGDGAEWLLERAPGWCGALDDDSDFDPPAGPI